MVQSGEISDVTLFVSYRFLIVILQASVEIAVLIVDDRIVDIRRVIVVGKASRA